MRLILFFVLISTSAFGQHVLKEGKIKWQMSKADLEKFEDSALMEDDDSNESESYYYDHEIYHHQASILYTFCPAKNNELQKLDYIIESPLLMDRGLNYGKKTVEEKNAYDLREQKTMAVIFQDLYEKFTKEHVSPMRFSYSYKDGGEWHQVKKDNFQALLDAFIADKHTKKIESHWMSDDKQTYVHSSMHIFRRKSPAISVSMYSVDKQNGKNHTCK